jgi:hypothetical protein
MKFSAAVLSLALAFGSVSGIAQSAGSPVHVFKSPTCGCCAKWVDHLRQHGFVARVTDLDDSALDELKAKHRVPRTAQSCHTALVDGYVIEGHVPASDVRRLLKERPAVSGIAVAGMPLGSPGMDVPAAQAQTYNVVTFDQKGAVRVFATHNGAR